MVGKAELIAKFLWRFRYLYYVVCVGAILNFISLDLRGSDVQIVSGLLMLWLVMLGFFVAQYRGIAKRLFVERLKVGEDQTLHKFLLSDTCVRLTLSFYILWFLFLCIATVLIVFSS